MVVFRMKINPYSDCVSDENIVEQNTIKLCKIMSDDFEDEKKIENKNVVLDDINNDDINITDDRLLITRNIGFGNSISRPPTNRFFAYANYTGNTRFGDKRGKHRRRKHNIIKNDTVEKNR